MNNLIERTEALAERHEAAGMLVTATTLRELRDEVAKITRQRDSLMRQIARSNTARFAPRIGRQATLDQCAEAGIDAATVAKVTEPVVAVRKG